MTDEWIGEEFPEDAFPVGTLTAWCEWCGDMVLNQPPVSIRGRDYHRSCLTSAVEGAEFDRW